MPSYQTALQRSASPWRSSRFWDLFGAAPLLLQRVLDKSGFGQWGLKLCAQMGGPEGVRETEQYTLVVGLQKGMLMHAIPRAATIKEE